MIDLITVVFRDELPILQKQAKSIELFCQDMDLEKIYVVVNDDRVDLSEIELSWWGSLKDRVVLVHRSAWRLDYANNGWLTQQLLKLLATDLSTSEWCMVLDAKTIFVNPMLKIDGRPHVGQLNIYPVFEKSCQIVNQLFNIELTQQLGPGGVPFILNTELAQEMMADIAQLTGQSFPNWFQSQGMVTEFILYSGYVVHRLGSFAPMYNVNLSTLRPCNLCHSEVASFDRKFNEMQSANTVSIHRNAWTQLSANQQTQYYDFLASKGIR
jgi:hypothetical protein